VPRAESPRGKPREARGVCKTLIALKAAGPEDEAIVLSLRNDPEIRRWFFNPDPVAPEAHARWYQETLTGLSRRLYLIMKKGTEAPIGYVRFDRTAPDVAEISVAISPSHRGRGYAQAALVDACRRFREPGEIRRMVARVLTENEASMKAFRSAGFVPVSTGSMNGRAVSVLELSDPASYFNS